MSPRVMLPRPPPILAQPVGISDIPRIHLPLCCGELAELQVLLGVSRGESMRRAEQVTSPHVIHRPHMVQRTNQAAKNDCARRGQFFGWQRTNCHHEPLVCPGFVACKHAYLLHGRPIPWLVADFIGKRHSGASLTHLSARRLPGLATQVLIPRRQMATGGRGWS